MTRPFPQSMLAVVSADVQVYCQCILAGDGTLESSLSLVAIHRAEAWKPSMT